KDEEKRPFREVTTISKSESSQPDSKIEIGLPSIEIKKPSVADVKEEVKTLFDTTEEEEQPWMQKKSTIQMINFDDAEIQKLKEEAEKSHKEESERKREVSKFHFLLINKKSKKVRSSVD